MEVYTVAHAWVLFERLIYKNVVRKQNRRLYLAACLYVSKKLLEEEIFIGEYNDYEKEEKV